MFATTIRGVDRVFGDVGVRYDKLYWDGGYFEDAEQLFIHACAEYQVPLALFYHLAVRGPRHSNVYGVLTWCMAQKAQAYTAGSNAYGKLTLIEEDGDHGLWRCACGKQLRLSWSHRRKSCGLSCATRNKYEANYFNLSDQEKGAWLSYAHSCPKPKPLDDWVTIYRNKQKRKMLAKKAG